MNKLKKGLKKKKGKKHAEDDLFSPEQLAKYKREKELAAQQQQDAEGASEKPSTSNEEWQRFQLLTAGIDDVLKKTSGDLDRIKSDSFYQKKPPPPLEPPRHHTEHAEHSNDYQGDAHATQQHEWVAEEAAAEENHEAKPTVDEVDGHAGAFAQPVEVPDEPPISLGDELFDTSFVEAIASGEIKLAYIPESPTEPDSEDPFDTSGVADVVKKIEEANKKEKRKVDLGLAVNRLTSSAPVAAPTEQPKSAVASSVDRRSKRRALYNVNLLGTFDEGTQIPTSQDVQANSESVPVKDVFDVELGEAEPNNNAEIELHPTPVVKQSAPDENAAPEKLDLKELLSEFEEFPSSEQCSAPVTASLALTQENDDEFDEFDELALASIHQGQEPPEPEEEDPFDTSYVKPGHADESESVLDSIDCDVPVQVPVTVAVAEKKAGPSRPQPPPPPSHFEDPFDTSTLEVTQPCPAQLKLIEEEFLQKNENDSVEPVKPSHVLIEEKIGRKLSVDSDFEFDPRKDEPPREVDIEETLEPEPEPHPLDAEHDFDESVENKALTPLTQEEVELDPFDTSAVSASVHLPGPLELRQLESELVQPDEFEFAPIVAVPDDPFITQPIEADDFFRVDEQVHSSEVLNPVQYESPTAKEAAAEFEDAHDFEDPFDTSHLITKDIFTGKVEIKDLENELLSTKTDVRPPRPQIPQIHLDKMSRRPGAEINHPLDEAHTDEHAKTPLKPLSPINPLFNGLGDDIDDPFDTSIADIVRPTNVEIRLLEEELQKP